MLEIDRKIHLPIKRAFVRSILHQQLADVFKLAHVGELLLHQLLHAAAHAHWDDLQAAAGWEHDHVGQGHGLNISGANNPGYGEEAHQCVYFENITQQSSHELSSSEPKQRM